MLSDTEKWSHNFEKLITYTINLKSFDIYALYYNKLYFNANVYILETLIYILSQRITNLKNYTKIDIRYSNMLLDNVSVTLFLNKFKNFQLFTPKSMVL